MTIVDNFATGKRENVNLAATLLEHDIREPFAVDADVIFHLAAQADVQTSMQRPEYDAAVNVVGTVNVLASSERRTGDLRVLGRGGLRRVHRARRRAGAVPAVVALRHREEVRRGVPRRLESHPRHARTSRSASRTSTARARTPASRAASSRSSSSASRAATRRSSTATGCTAGTSSTSATSSPRCSPRSVTAAARTTSAPARTRRSRSCTRRAHASPAVTPSRGSRMPGSATCGARCSTRG